MFQEKEVLEENFQYLNTVSYSSNPALALVSRNAVMCERINQVFYLM